MAHEPQVAHNYKICLKSIEIDINEILISFKIALLTLNIFIPMNLCSSIFEIPLLKMQHYIS